MKIFYTLILSLALIVVAFFSYSIVKDSSFSISSIPNIFSSKNTETTNQNTPSNSPSSSSSSSSSSTSSSTISGQVIQDPEDPEIQYEPHYCAPESRDIECDESQDVVCGWFTDQEATCEGPCVKIFVNTCQACSDSRVEYWTQGDCPIHG